MAHFGKEGKPEVVIPKVSQEVLAEMIGTTRSVAAMEINRGGAMPTHPRTHSDGAQIVAEILKEAAEPRRAASVKKALKKKRPAPVAPGTRGGSTEKVQPVPQP